MSGLVNNYQKLMMERIAIDKMALNNNTLNAAYRDSSETVTARYYEYIALLFTAILLIMLFFRFAGNSGVQSGGGNNFNITAFKVLIIIFFFIFYFNHKKIYNKIFIM